MPTSVSLPALGESVTEGTVTRWLKQVGDTVAVDEPLLEVSTDKVDTEIPSPVAGTLLEIKAAEDETVEVGAELAVIGDAGESSGSCGSGRAAARLRRPRPPRPRTRPGGSGRQAPAAGPGRSRLRPLRRPAAAGPPPRPPLPQAAARPRPPQRLRPRSVPGAASGTSVTLPALGESVTEGTVTRWLKQVGDDVAVDEPLLEVSTDKVDTEIPSPVAGKLLEIKVAEDETVEVGAELAIVGSGDAAPAASAPAPAAAPAEPARRPGRSRSGRRPGSAAAPAQAPAAAPAPQAAPARGSAPQPPAPAAPPAPAPQAAPAQAPGARSGRSGPGRSPNGSTSDGPNYVTPLVRKLAAEHEVDLDAVQGTGVGGRIRKQDVIAAAEAKKAAAAAPGRRSPGAPPPAAGQGRSGDQPAARHHREDEPDPQGDRDPHGQLAAASRPS